MYQVSSVLKQYIICSFEMEFYRLSLFWIMVSYKRDIDNINVVHWNKLETNVPTQNQTYVCHI